MSERPIPFRDWEVRAILDGRQTQTRRAIKPQPPTEAESVSRQLCSQQTPEFDGAWQWWGGKPQTPITKPLFCPYGAPGDTLWVRETFCAHWGAPPHDAPQSYRIATGDELPPIKQENGDLYQPVPSDIMTVWYGAQGDKPLHMAWRPSIHMPRWASRITLRITDVRVERLQDITQKDAIAEGAPESHSAIDRISRHFGYQDFSRSWFAQTWEEINGHDAWDDNPWVWALSFERVKP